jgi:hypothetical protein
LTTFDGKPCLVSLQEENGANLKKKKGVDRKKIGGAGINSTNRQKYPKYHNM